MSTDAMLIELMKLRGTTSITVRAGFTAGFRVGIWEPVLGIKDSLEGGGLTFQEALADALERARKEYGSDNE